MSKKKGIMQIKVTKIMGNVRNNRQWV